MFILWKDHTAVDEAELINKTAKSWGGTDYTKYSGGGGARGIGAATSLNFASAGANVVIDYLPIKSDLEGLEQVEAEMKKNRWTYMSYPGNVASPTEMDDLCSKTIEHFGSL